MVENQIISKIIKTGSIDWLESYGVDSSYFNVYLNEYKFIIDHLEHYNKVPDLETFLYKFKKFKLSDAYEPEAFLIDTIREEYFYTKVVGLLEESAKKLKENSFDSYEFMLSELQHLTPPSQIKGVDIISQATSRLEEWKEKKENPDKFFISTGLPELDKSVGGLSMGEELVLLYARTGIGKAMVNNTPVLTNKGWKPIGDIIVGDILSDMDGNPTKVTGVYKQGKKEVYEIGFNDGTNVKCCKDHLWIYDSVYNRINTNKSWKVNTTEEINSKNLIGKKGDYKYCIPVNKEINIFDESNHKIPSYLLGLLIGNGGLTDRNVTFTNSEDDIGHNFEHEINKLKDYRLHKKVFENHYQFTIRSNLSSSKNNFPELLKEIGLFGTKSSERFIPDSYKYDSLENRLNLVRGLIDTDGHVDRKGHIHLSTKSTKLAYDFQEVVRSLGYRVNVKPIKRTKGLEFDCYISGLTDTLFSSKKHNDRFRDRGIPTKNHNYNLQRITYIKKLNYSTDMTCLSVDSPSRSFICENTTVTHNTWVTLKIATSAFESDKRVGLFEPEMTANKIGYRFDTLHGGISNKKLLRGYDIDNYEDYITELKLNNNKFYVASPKDFDKNTTVTKLRSWIKSNKLDILLIDGISYLRDERYRRGDSKTTSLGQIAEDLMSVSQEMKIPIIIISQANREAEKEGGLQLSTVRDSDAISHQCTLAIAIDKVEDLLRLQLQKTRNGGEGDTFHYKADYDTGGFKFVMKEDINQIVEYASEVKYEDSGDVF